jgi:CheY-like chemotaxis protein
LRREETLALETVGLYLWDHYQLEKKWRNPTGPIHPTPSPEHATPAEIATPDRYSELEWLQQSIPYESVKIQDLLHEILTLAEAALHKQTIQIEFNLSENLPPVTTKRTTVRQALLSIVNNAIHALPGGTLEFSAEVRLSELSLVIEGWGETEINPIAFLDEERATVLRQLIELSGGTLSINAKGRDGSKFAATISLPVKNMIKVMVVDDNRDTLQFIARCLTGTRYLLIAVNEPEKAVEIASANQPQIIILDVMLPRIDGWELLGRFQHHPVLKEIPVVVFSILPQDQMAKDLGAMAFLKKPVSRDNLLAFLDQNLNHFLEQ